MRVLYIIPNYIPLSHYGGAVVTAHELHLAMAARGHEVEVWTTSLKTFPGIKTPPQQKVFLGKVQIRYFQSFFPKLAVAPEMSSELERTIDKFDIIHLHALYRWTTVMGARIAAKHKVPYVISTHGMLVKKLIRKKSFYAKKIWIELYEKNNLRKASGIHTTTPLEEAGIRELKLDLAPFFLVPWGTQVEMLSIKDFLTDSSQDSDSTPHKKSILFLGRICWTKAIDKLVMAMRYIQDAQLLIAGPDEDGLKYKIEQLAEKLGVRSRVVFLGHLKAKEKFFYLSRSSLMVLPSHSENFGNVILEAMAVGCPVVVSKWVGLADMVRETGVGIVTDNDPKIMGPAIQELLQDEERLKQMSQRGPMVVSERYTWPRVAERMEAVYLKILKSHDKYAAQ